ncbi:MAG: 2,4-dihydroxyhept-2-ene-1,7-dioic acid aldolase [Candidatus Omnitrophica bacterium]|nr:2,4-dihydroxyhept-2-ene-1,7-dioic acid aldolase [Candidatus Omnitrophota bacterium]
MTLKARLRSGKLTIGSWITIGNLSVAEIMARAGFDWLAIDMEHSAITLDKAQELIQVIGLCGTPALVRVGENDPVVIKRVMDAGAQGVIVPMINSARDALAAVRAVKYPPMGTRGVGLARAQGYGLGFSAYAGWVNRGSIVIAQIEHITAVDNLDEILAVDGIDAFIVGPYDLSASMGIPGKFEDLRVKNALSRIMRTAKVHKAVAGFHVIPPNAKEVLKKVREGYRFVGFSLDTLFLGAKCRDEFSLLKDGLKR